APGIGITWTVVSGSATLVSPTSPTDAAGRAQTGLQFGPTPGTVVVRAARNDDLSVFVDFTLTSTLTRTLLLVSGNGQSGPTNTALPAPLVIEARDNGLAAPGIGITWTVVSGSATPVSPTSPTDAAGRAQTGLQFGPTPGTVVVRAARNDDLSVFVDFTLTSTLTRTLLLVSGNGQSGPTNTALPAPLVIEARDNGLAAPGIGITWTVVSGSATLVSPTSPTDAAGRAQTGLQFGPTPGTVVIRAARNDDLSVFVEFSLTSTLVRTVSIVSGANQQGLPGLPLPSPIVVEVRANGLPEAGIEVDLSASGNASVAGSGATPKLVKLTDGAGRASFVVTLGPSPGPVTLTASLPADPSVSASTVVNASSLASLPGLPPELQSLGEVLEGACAAIAALPPTSRSPEQVDLLARCQDFPGAPPAEVIAALRELVPDTTLVMVNIALGAGQAQLDNLKARIAALRSGTRGSAFGGLAIATPSGRIPVSGLVENLLGPAASDEAGADFDRFGWFVSGTLGRGESREGRLTPGYDFDINGLTAGLDYRFSDRFIAGASLGLTRQDSDLTGAQGKVEASGWSVSGYATVYQAHQWYSDVVLTWGRNEYDTLRRVRYTITGPGGSTTIDRSARGRLDGDLLSFAATVGRDWQAGGWTVGPYGRLLYTRIDFDSAREMFEGTGPGAGLALEVFPGTHTSLASVAGAKFSRAISRDWGILMPHFQFEWEREYKEDPQRVGARFLADPSARIFTVQGDPIDNSFYRLGAGLSALFTGGRSGFLYVERVLGKSGFSQTNLALGLRGEF
ncbi:MAG: autotransporter outer membrane beta-barrel domain-containing protein, partial [Silanimonas lenta]